MGIPFSPRAAFCTFLVVVSFGAGVAAGLPGGLVGLIGMERDGLLTIDGGGMPREDDQGEIVSAVLAHEASKTERGPVCIELADEGEALASERTEIAQVQRAVANADPALRASLITDLDRLRSRARSWLKPLAAGLGGSRALGAENMRQLRSAETALLGMPAPDRVDFMLDVGSLPQSLRANARGCPVLTFTAPAMAGEVAFVETRFSAAAGPAEEAWLYAVAREDGRWQVGAMTRQ